MKSKSIKIIFILLDGLLVLFHVLKPFTAIIIAIVGLIALEILGLIYRPKPDSCIVFVGGLGSGKSIISVRQIDECLDILSNKVVWHNFKQYFRKKQNREFWEKPVCYSSIPVRVRGRQYSLPFDESMALLETRPKPRCVTFIDEVSLFINQMQVKFPGAKSLEEYITLYRHYTQGGYLILNTQNSSKVNFNIRYCLNRAYALAEFRRIWRIYWVKCRDISLIDDVKSVSTGMLEDDYKYIIGFLPFRRRYDTYVYSERVKNLPFYDAKPFSRLKRNKINRFPLDKEGNQNLNEVDDE